MEECHEVMKDCKNTLETLILDEENQRLAARVAFEWTPVKKWAGVEPTGKRATFSEHVFVWFDEGRMHTSVTLLDMDAFRRQMQA
ncbi:hypothetical protein CMUS01_08065 [Colletotrichum musicola]|uniref:Uncharacterized protein n=1 Tax=Colletotrichum musicola TaxID=2175873 RepID=A0A8H6KDJ0_9PEZI|nr:hypothetical protein CMUS01_08065 [Colletotrichum musicola]